MTEPTTPRGRKIYSLSCTIQDHAEAAAIAYERGDILARSYSERHADDARDELSGLVEEMEADLARATAVRDAAIASRDEWRGVAEEGARQVQASYLAESHLDMVSTGRSLVAWSVRVLPIAEPDPLDKAPLDHGRSGDANEEPDVYQGPIVVDIGEALKRSMGTKAEPGRNGE